MVARSKRQERPIGSSDHRRGGGLRRLPGLLGRLLDPAARRRGLAEARILTDWPTIVGPRLAERCQPVRLGRERGAGGGVLQLRVAGAAALELQHSEPQLLERINGFFGYPAVCRLRLIQAPPERRAAVQPPNAPRPLDEAAAAAVEAAVGGVGDPELRSALAALGRTLKTRGAHGERPGADRHPGPVASRPA